MDKDQVGTIEECLYSIANRVEIAKVLKRLGRTKLLETELEDIVWSVQVMCYEHCVAKELKR